MIAALSPGARRGIAVAVALLLVACTPRERERTRAETGADAGTGHLSGTRGIAATYTVRDTTLSTTLDASGVAEPVQEATLSTRIMGTVVAVLAHEGDVVTAGAPLVHLDARDLAARDEQTSAALAAAEAVRADAARQAARIRALYADSAATRAQLDAAETGLASAEAGVRTARGASAELAAVRSYAVVRAPFAGVVTRRFIDPGAFAAPGTPLITVQDVSRLRLTASAAPDAVRGLRRGQTIAATIEGRSVLATIEGVVPAPGGSLYTVNALLPNARREFLAGSAVTLSLPRGSRPAVVVPASAVVRTGDLTGVTLRRPDGDVTRWVRLGATVGTSVEVTAGLRAGELVVLPAAAPASISTRE